MTHDTSKVPDFTPKPVITDRLDADTKVIVKFLLDNRVRVNTPVDIKFFGDKKAVVSLMSVGFWQPQVAVVTRVAGMLFYKTVNCTSPLATIE